MLAKMLSLDSIDPFDSPEAKPYKTDPDILAMTSLLHVRTERNELTKHTQSVSTQTECHRLIRIRTAAVPCLDTSARALTRIP